MQYDGSIDPSIASVRVRIPERHPSPVTVHNLVGGIPHNYLYLNSHPFRPRLVPSAARSGSLGKLPE